MFQDEKYLSRNVIIMEKNLVMLSFRNNIIFNEV